MPAPFRAGPRKQGCTARRDRYNRRPMPRAFAATLGSILAACAAPTSAPQTVFGGEHDSLVEAPQPSPSGETARASEAELRARLARDDDPGEAAIELARQLDREGRLVEALLAIDTALQRATGPQLQIARAGVLRDLGRRSEALAQLTAVADGPAGAGAAPGLLFEWAELAALEDHLALARHALQRLEEAPDFAAFAVDRQAELAALRQALAAGRRLVPVRVRDVLGELRGNADAAVRRSAFMALFALGGDPASTAVAAILDDPDAELRSLGVRSASVPVAALAEFCALALSDPAPAVRRAGAERAAVLPAAEAAALLLPTMTSEADAEAFTAMHATLHQLTGTGAELTAAAAADPALRAALVAQWRTRWERGSSSAAAPATSARTPCRRCRRPVTRCWSSTTSAKGTSPRCAVPTTCAARCSTASC